MIGRSGHEMNTEANDKEREDDEERIDFIQPQMESDHKAKESDDEDLESRVLQRLRQLDQTRESEDKDTRQSSSQEFKTLIIIFLHRLVTTLERSFGPRGAVLENQLTLWECWEELSDSKGRIEMLRGIEGERGRGGGRAGGGAIWIEIHEISAHFLSTSQSNQTNLFLTSTTPASC